VPTGKVTAEYAGGNDPWKGLGYGTHGHWQVQGADAGLYTNSDIHAVRILIQEPTTDVGPRRFSSHAMERLRILGEIPVRHFDKTGKQPLDPDGNPDTSFLAKIPADTSFTFQTLDRDGMVLNMAQTWHQVRPGEVRNDCGGCHAHSQKPTDFRLTAAAKPDYVPFDLTRRTPLLTARGNDQSRKKWDRDDETGLRYEDGVKNVEYFRDVKPILERSCVACHTEKWDKPAGNLILDADHTRYKYEYNTELARAAGGAPSTYFRLAMDNGRGHSKDTVRFGHKPVGDRGWPWPMASRYVWMLQSRRSLLVWKIFGKRLDGFRNEDHPSEPEPGAGYLMHRGERFTPTKKSHPADIDYTGSVMPPPEAVAGTYKGPDGKAIKVAPLTDEDRRTIVRWIDLGCPIDLDFDPQNPDRRGYGWQADDQRPTLTLAEPQPGPHTAPLERILIGMDDVYTGLDLATFQVIADFPVDGVAPGRNLASKFRSLPESRWELQLATPLTSLAGGKLTVSVKDRQGNVSRIERSFAIKAVSGP
jgi:hypothetical protein